MDRFCSVCRSITPSDFSESRRQADDDKSHNEPAIERGPEGAKEED